MCMIVVKSKDSVVNKEHLTQANHHNKDGFGVSYYDGKEVVVFKTLDFDAFLEVVEEINAAGIEAVLHMRNTSAGACSIDNAQPIKLSNGESLAHNGTVFNLAYHSVKSDSVLLGEIVQDLPNTAVKDRVIEALIGEDRVAIMSADGTVKRYGSWVELDGCYYSSDYYKKEDVKVSHWDDWYSDVTLVAVYGTLKMGYGNHRLLEDAMFEGEAVTAKKYPMVDNGYFPYLFNEDGGDHVKVEVYAVDADTLARLDALEGVDSGHYYREEVEVVFDDGFTEMVNIYFACHSYTGEETISEF